MAGPKAKPRDTGTDRDGDLPRTSLDVDANANAIPPRSALPDVDVAPLTEVTGSGGRATENDEAKANAKAGENEEEREKEKAKEDEKEKEEDGAVRPSSRMTREMPAMTVESLLAGSRHESNPKIIAAAVPAPAPTTRTLDDDPLAVTAESPVASTLPLARSRILLLDAAEVLMTEIEFKDVTELEIARRASASIDDLRTHFPDKNALLRALCTRFCDQAITLTNEVTHIGIWDLSSPRDVIEVGVRSILDVVLGRAALVRAVLGSGDPAMLEEFRGVGVNVTERVVRVLEHTEGSPESRPDPSDVAFAFLLAVSLAHHTIMVGSGWSGLDFDREELYERASAAAKAYLARSAKKSRSEATSRS